MPAHTITDFRSIDAVTVSGAGTTTGRWMQIRHFPRFTFQASWTGTLNGTFTWEVTNRRAGDAGDQPRADAVATVLTVPATFTAGNPAGSAGDFAFIFANMSQGWIRPKLLYVSGSGVLTVTGAGNGS